MSFINDYIMKKLYYGLEKLYKKHGVFNDMDMSEDIGNESRFLCDIQDWDEIEQQEFRDMNPDL